MASYDQGINLKFQQNGQFLECSVRIHLRSTSELDGSPGNAATAIVRGGMSRSRTVLSLGFGSSPERPCFGITNSIVQVLLFCFPTTATDERVSAPAGAGTIGADITGVVMAMASD